MRVLPDHLLVRDGLVPLNPLAAIPGRLSAVQGGEAAQTQCQPSTTSRMGRCSSPASAQHSPFVSFGECSARMKLTISRRTGRRQVKDTDLRRRASRHPVRWKAAVVFDHIAGKPIVQTQTEDLSPVGAAIFSNQADLTGSNVHLLLAYSTGPGGKSQKVLKVRARVVSTVQTPGMSQYRHGLSFMRSPDDGLGVLDEILGTQGPSVVSPETGGVPQRLAHAKRVQSRKIGPFGDTSALISDALGKAHRYLKELVIQLNAVHPAYPKRYVIVGVPEFAGLAWTYGYTGLQRRQILPQGRLNSEASLSFRISGKKQISVAREYPANEKLRRFLGDSQLEFTAQDTRNKRGLIERTTFVVSCEVAASLVLLGQFDAGKLLLRTRNVCGFGSMEQILAPEAITDDSLSELGAFILCEAVHLGPLLLKNA